MLSNNNLNELVQATSIKLKLSQFAVLKDFYITKVIQLLTAIHDENFALVFQGGTSLSKGYKIINRLSEDVDFRVIEKQAAVGLSKDKRRKKLRQFRHLLVNTLIDSGFDIPQQAVNVLYEGRFMAIQAKFTHVDEKTYLKPYVAIECFVGKLILEPELRPISTLAKVTLGEICEHPTFPVACVALDETVAEKWVALTRRVSTHQHKPRATDKHLVRHLYDLSSLYESGLLTGDYYHIAKLVMEKDKHQFKSHNIEYYDDPITTSELALAALKKDPAWQEHWKQFLEEMVYDEAEFSFEHAYHNLDQISDSILRSIKNT